MNAKRLESLCFVLLFFSAACAQPKEWVVVVESGRTYPDVRCEELRDGLLILRRSKADRDTLRLDSVVSISRASRANVLVGAIGGVLVGGSLGGVIGGKTCGETADRGLLCLDDVFYGVLIGSIVGGVAGGVIIANSDEDKHWYLSQLTLEGKRALLKEEIINK